MYARNYSAPHRRLTVSTAATNRLLTSLARVKQALGIADTENDTLISELITRASDEIVSYLRMPYADDGSAPTLARETFVETLRSVHGGSHELFLTRRPIVSVTSVVEDGATLTADTDFQVNRRLGGLLRMVSDDYEAWSADKVVVTYQAGYLLPNSDSRDLPYDIEEAAIYTISARLSDLNATVGDPEIRSESLEGAYSATYQTSGATSFGSGGLPTRARALLASHRNIMI
jgi:hypothetical protein